MRTCALMLTLVAGLAASSVPAQPELVRELPQLRPRPQLMQAAKEGFALKPGTRVLIPRDCPPYLRVSARELAAELSARSGLSIRVEEADEHGYRKGDITVGLHERIGHLPWLEPTPQGIVRPGPEEGYNVRITPEYVVLAGNSMRACFHGLQTLLQIARQCERTGDTLELPGLFIADWPAHGWRSLQLPFGVYGSAYERGEHRYRHITRTDLLERSVRLAAHHKLTGLVVEIGCGMKMDRLPEIFVEGFTQNDKASVRAVADKAKALGLELTAFMNASAAHDIWLAPYPYAALDTDLYREALFEAFDEVIETLRPANFLIGMDEDVAQDFNENPLRDPKVHKELILLCHEYLIRQGLRTLVWNDGISLLGKEAADLPRDIIVLPWLYGGNDFTSAKRYLDDGFRILCSPWSQWHVENDQFYSIYAASLASERVLGMAGTIWYPVPPDAETDYRRCLVKAADAFWSPMLAGDYPNQPEYYVPSFEGISYTQEPPIPLAADDMARLVQVLIADGDPMAKEAARERMVAGGAVAGAALVSALAGRSGPVPAWAEGTLRRIVREPRGDVAPLIAALRECGKGTGEVRALALEMLGLVGEVQYLADAGPLDIALCNAMAASGDGRFRAALRDAAAVAGEVQVAALRALGLLKATDELLGLAEASASFSEEAREAYARALSRTADARVVPVLATLAEDANWRVRFRAAVGLGATRSAQAAPHILRLLNDHNPSVFKVALYWCTDTYMVKPEDYFPRLCARLRPGEDAEIVRPILHALLLMWKPQAGQWLAKGEDSTKRIDYARLPVWKSKPVLDALKAMYAYPDARLAIDAMTISLRIGTAPDAKSVADTLMGYGIEDRRWFCVRMRDEQLPAAAPILRRLWDVEEDRMVRAFILHYCSRTPTQEVFDLAYHAVTSLKDPQMKAWAATSLAAHVNRLDDNARRAIPILLEVWEKAGPEERGAFDAALCRASGQKPLDRWISDPEESATRLAAWKAWWSRQ